MAKRSRRGGGKGERGPDRMPVRVSTCTECHTEGGDVHLIEYRMRSSGGVMLGHICTGCMQLFDVLTDCGPVRW